MKKYNPNKYIPESVIRVDKYAKLITDHLISVFEKDIKNEKLPFYAFCEKINKFFSKYNIIFNPMMLNFKDLLRSDIQDGIVTMETGSKSLQIRVNVCANVLNIFKDSEFFYKKFLPNFKLLISHELIHRIQFMKNKTKYISQPINDFDNYISYDELMSYAFQTIEEFRFAGMDDNSILKKIKSTKDEEKTVSTTFDFYRTDIKKRFIKQYNQYLKYMFEYLKGNLTKNNYVFIEHTLQNENKEVFRRNFKSGLRL